MASPSLFRIACLVLPLVHLLSAAFHVYGGAMNADEGFYAIAARSVMEGDLPYRDFGYTQLPLAGGVAIELYRLDQTWTPTRRLALVAGLALAHVGVIPAYALASGRTPTLASAQAWLPSNVAPYTFDLRARLLRARGIVEQLVPPSQPLLGPNIILAAETGRAVPRAARMGPFSTTSEYDADTARRLNLLTYPELHGWLADPNVPLLAFFTTARVNYAWTVPSFKLQPREDAEQWLSVLRRDFVIVQQDPDFLLVARPAVLPPALRP